LLPLFILEDYQVADDPRFQFGYPSRWFVGRALPAYFSQFPIGVVVRGRAAQYLIGLDRQFEISVHVNDDIYPDFGLQVEKLRTAGVAVSVANQDLSVSKDVRTGAGTVYSVFTPFKKAVWQSFVTVTTEPAPDFSGLIWLDAAAASTLPAQIALADVAAQFPLTRRVSYGDTVLDLSESLPLPDLSGWYTTATDARSRLQRLLDTGVIDRYADRRDSLEGDVAGGRITGGQTSRLSLALAWGLLSAREIMVTLRERYQTDFPNPFAGGDHHGPCTFISELIWREFYRYQLFHHPELMHTEFQERFRGTIQWETGQEAERRFLAWIRGETGYPIVDAAMRQIAATGWMHNRARMIVASILTKNFGVDWRWGQEYFRASLIDLDEASNNGGWQWGASVGADPKPIRIFNPELQAENYDGSGKYRDQWLSSTTILQSERVPLIEHRVARQEALRRYGLTEETPRDY
jgi:deoxyribodipyrimidine photo-lyase